MANNWHGFIGQDDRIGILKRMHDNRKRTHVLLQGPPGTGKTTLANILSNNNLITVVGANCRNPDKFAMMIKAAVDQSVETLFIDEVHSARKQALEVLYPVMEEGKLFLFGEMVVADIYVIAATTDGGLLPKPFVDRFGVDIRLRPYNFEEMKDIVKDFAKFYEVKITSAMVEDIATRAMSTPRTARKLVALLRSFNNDWKKIGEYRELVNETGIEADGLQPTEIQVIKTMWEKFDGGPVGVATLAMACGIDVQTLTKYVEPILINLRYLTIEKRGRELTKEGKKRAISGAPTK